MGWNPIPLTENFVGFLVIIFLESLGYHILPEFPIF